MQNGKRARAARIAVSLNDQDDVDVRSRQVLICPRGGNGCSLGSHAWIWQVPTQFCAARSTCQFRHAPDSTSPALPRTPILIRTWISTMPSSTSLWSGPTTAGRSSRCSPPQLLYFPPFSAVIVAGLSLQLVHRDPSFFPFTCDVAGEVTQYESTRSLLLGDSRPHS